MQNNRRTGLVIVVLTAATLFMGTVGYSILFAQNLFDSFLDAAYVMFTHWRHEDDPRDVRILSLSVGLMGFVVIAYLVKWFVEELLGGSINERMRHKRMVNNISKLKNHYLVCGQGRVGVQVARELADDGVAFVVIDKDGAKLEPAREGGWMYLELDSTDEDALEAAGIRRAKGLITCLGEDADNILVTLTARSLNPELVIVARANNKKLEAKLLKAGADKVSLPHLIGGYHMASMAIRPTAADFCDVVLDTSDENLVVDGLKLTPKDRSVGKTIEVLVSGVPDSPAIIAINRNGKSIVNPRGQETLKGGDTLILLGTKSSLAKAQTIFG